MTEKDWQSWVVELAQLMGWRIAHFRPADTGKGWRTPMLGSPGWPDLTLVRPPRLLFAELKVNPATQIKGRPSPEQELWLAELRQVPGAEVYVWRPPDKDQVIETLTRRS